MAEDAQRAISTVEQFLRATEKQGAGGEPVSEPQGLSDSSHPVTTEEDSLHQGNIEGDHGRDNSREVRQQVPGGGVTAGSGKGAMDDNEVANQPGNYDQYDFDQGTDTSATGEDPTAETASAKSEKDETDAGTSHPASMDNPDAARGNNKYANDPDADLLEAANVMSKSANALCEQLSQDGHPEAQKQARGGEKCAKCGMTKDSEGNCPSCDEKSAMEDGQSCSQCNGGTMKKQDGKYKCDNCGHTTDAGGGGGGDKSAETRQKLASQIGWDMAGLVTGNIDKQAAHRIAEGTIAATIKSACDGADRVGDYIARYKQAMEGDDESKEEGSGGSDDSGGNGGGSGGGNGNGGGNSQPAEAAGGGGEAPAQAPAPPPEAEPAPAEPAPAEQGQGMASPDMLEQVLTELGVSEDELMEALGMGGQGGGQPMVGGEAMAGGGMGMGGMEATAKAGAAQQSPGGQVTKEALERYVAGTINQHRQQKAAGQAS